MAIIKELCNTEFTVIERQKKIDDGSLVDITCVAKASQLKLDTAISQEIIDLLQNDESKIKTICESLYNQIINSKGYTDIIMIPVEPNHYCGINKFKAVLSMGQTNFSGKISIIIDRNKGVVNMLKIDELKPSEVLYHITEKQYLSLANDKIEELIGERLVLSLFVDALTGFACIVVSEDDNTEEQHDKLGEKVFSTQEWYEFTEELMSLIFNTGVTTYVSLDDYGKCVDSKEYDKILITITK